MFDQNDVEIVDSDLADEEDRGLHAFIEGWGQTDACWNAKCRPGDSCNVGHCHRCDDSRDDACYSQAVVE